MNVVSQHDDVFSFLYQKDPINDDVSVAAAKERSLPERPQSDMGLQSRPLPII